MSLREEIQAIKDDPTLSYEEKGKKMSKLVTSQELGSLLPKNQKGQPALKEPLKPKRENMRIINVSLYNVYFEQIERGTKKIEYRDWSNEYYQKKCSYVENGKRYLVPFDAITFHVGNKKSMTVALTDITCNGTYLMFHLGEILRKQKN